MKILVCGGRKFNRTKFLYETLDEIIKKYKTNDPIIIHGRAPGADLLARAWAVDRGFRDRGYPAKWHIHGDKAGPIRNTQMLDEESPDLVVAFPGTVGTADMVDQADARGYTIERIWPNAN